MRADVVRSIDARSDRRLFHYCAYTISQELQFLIVLRGNFAKCSKIIADNEPDNRSTVPDALHRRFIILLNDKSDGGSVQSYQIDRRIQIVNSAKSTLTFIYLIKEYEIGG